MRWAFIPILIGGLTQPTFADAVGGTNDLVARAELGMRNAAAFFRARVARHGSYVWEVSVGLDWRKGEGVTTEDQGWVQPPGTPSVGRAYLAAYHATGEQFYLEAAVETAEALVSTQLESGGWWPLLEYDSEARRSWCYRVNAADRPACKELKGNKQRTATILDDNMSQSALAFLILVDATLNGSNSGIRDAIEYGLKAFISMQYPNGAWPVRFDHRLPDALTQSAWRARTPQSWPRQYVEPQGEVYILNDHAQRDTIRLFLLADQIYGRPEYRAAARRGGEFLLRAQMPGEQAGWAQTYNSNLEPIWGRKFEPPAVASNETAGAVDALLDLYRVTGERRYLEGAEPAVKWLLRSRLSDGDWARFYELETNEPLYMDASYRLSSSWLDAPGHYTFKGGFGIPDVLERYDAISRYGADAATRREPTADVIAAKTEEILAALDRENRWIVGERIPSATFIENMEQLAWFVADRRNRPLPDPTKLLPLHR